MNFSCVQIIENSIEVEENELLVTLEAQGLVGLVHCAKQVRKNNNCMYQYRVIGCVGIILL